MKPPGIFVGLVMKTPLIIMNNIFHLAQQCLTESNLDKKILLSLNAKKIILDRKISFDLFNVDLESLKPGRPEKPVLITPKDVPRRNIQTIEGRAAMIHSFAHIEFNAINLAWDLICRFQNMPEEFYFDWTQVAAEETKHFNLLRNNLNAIGYDYGDFSAHDGLWTIADKTKHDILLRLAVVPRIMEARGLDVTPNLIERFRQIKDFETVAILEVILEEEIGHVLIGTKWYRYICDKLNQEPEEKFRKIVDEFLPSTTTKKINHKARLKAGFTQAELDYLAPN
jgi:uncharacterized ferritin-like protein (DUF455 family)